MTRPPGRTSIRGRRRGPAVAAPVVWLGAFVTVGGLVTGADWLTVRVLGTALPLANLALAVCFTALPAAALPWLASGALRGLAVVLAASGLLWLPISAWLAGNFRLDFTSAPEWWWPVTMGLPLLSLLLWLGIGVRAVCVRSLRRADRGRG